MKISPSTYIVDPLFPTREIHMIAGSSGAGKSTLVSQICDMLTKGHDIFGYTPNSISGIAYLAFDRTLAGMGRTFERSLQTDDTSFPFYSTIDSPEFSEAKYRSPVGALKRLKDLHPEVDILIVDGLGVAFAGDSSKIHEVANFIHEILRALRQMKSDLTIFAIHHTAKTKKGNEYTNARAKLHGSVAWAATCETIILIESEDEEDSDNPNRLLTICPRNLPERSYTYCFDEHGRLIPGNKLLDPIAEDKKVFFNMVDCLNENETISTDGLYRLTEGLGISRSTFKRWLADLTEGTDYLEKISRGVYRRRATKAHS